MILADTSVWVDHLRRADARLVAQLRQGRIGMHPMVAGELACGSLGDVKSRRALLSAWDDLPRLLVVSDPQARQFIELHRLMGQGIGLIDVHLLASVAAHKGARLWTGDKRLAALAAALGLAFELPA